MSDFSKFWLKLTNWEFWPVDLVYLPIKLYYIFLALKNRSFFFFTAANPSIEFGGLTGISKYEIYKLIPVKYLPDMKLISAGDCASAEIAASSMEFPLILKPDKGERGNLVQKAHTIDEVLAYAEKCPIDFLLQEFVDLPLELGVFYSRHPDEDMGRVTSVVEKEFLSVIGDGVSSVGELLKSNARAHLQLDLTHRRFSGVISQVPKRGERMIIEHIGNHCRGTIFLNREGYIDQKLTEAIDQLAKEINGFYYGRFDLRCGTLEDLKSLRNFKIIELNGAASEPAHIYQPGYSMVKAYQSLFWHYTRLSKISDANHKRNIPYWSFKLGNKKLKEAKELSRKLRSL